MGVEGEWRRWLAVGCPAHLPDHGRHGGIDSITFELTFPDGDRCPAHPFELVYGSLIAFDVAGELFLPKLDVTLGHAGIAVRAAVPKTAVDKDGDLASRKGDVGLAGNLPLQTISREPGRAQALAYDQLGFGIGAFVAMH